MDHPRSIFSTACSNSGRKVYIRHVVHFLRPELDVRSCFQEQRIFRNIRRYNLLRSESRSFF